MEEKKEGVTRRSFLSNTAVGAIGLAAASFTASSLINPREVHAANLAIGTTDFPQIPLDVEKIRQYGYFCYQKMGGCGLGSSRALIQGFLDAHAAAGSDPKGWAQIPLNLYQWGAGGGMGKWGTLCGALAGSLGVLNLMNLHGELGTAVMQWYTKQNFPLANLDNFDGNMVYGGFGPILAPIKDADVKGHSVSDSPLCHISVSKWVAAAGVKLGDKNALGQGLKEDRCGKVTADTAAYTAQLLNDKLAGKIAPVWSKPEAMAGCYDCHDTYSPSPATKKDAQTLMDCLPCHTETVSGRK
ncbi:MAG: C-GCAxxG-C-C family (seleno)protein [Mycobacterium leprae]